jgi:hypothetical protein
LREGADSAGRRAEFEGASTISEEEFRRLCEELYDDREQAYGFNPNAGRADALMWVLLGSLLSLLSVTEEEQSELFDAADADPYGEAVRRLLLKRARPHFDPAPRLADLRRKSEMEA